MAKVLILDHSKSMRNTLRERLEYEGFSTEGVESRDEALGLCERKNFDAILAEEGSDVTQTGIPFIVLAAEPTIDSAIRAVRSGAQDYLTRPIDMNRLLKTLHRTVEASAEPASAPAARPTRARRARSGPVEPIVGTSPAIERVKTLIGKVAPSEARVLITGENGTGKELVARWLHAESRRAPRPSSRSTAPPSPPS